MSWRRSFSVSRRSRGAQADRAEPGDRASRRLEQTRSPLPRGPAQGIGVPAPAGAGESGWLGAAEPGPAPINARRYFSANRIVGIAVALLATALLAGCGAAAPQAAGAGLLAVAGSGQLSQINLLDLTPRHQLQLGAPLPALAPDAVHHRLDVLLGGPQPAFLELDDTLRQHSRRPLSFQPRLLLLAADGRLAYIAGAAGASTRILALDLTSGQITQRTSLPGLPLSLAAAPDGASLLLGMTQPNRLVRLTAPALRLAEQLPLPAPPAQMQVLPYGHKAFLLCGARLAVVSTRPLGLLTYLLVGSQPQALLLKPDGGELYVSNAAGAVTAVNTTANQVTDSIAAGRGAGAIAISSDGSILYVANAEAGTISVITLVDRRQIAVVHVGETPSALQLSPDGRWLFAADAGSDDVAVVRTSLDRNNPNSLVTLLPAPPSPAHLLVMPQ
ncbi:MAG: YncE family protein [Terriglobales bacterium]